MRMSFLKLLTCVTILIAESTSAARSKKPNIIFIVADDLGWNDVGWNNPSMQTPHMNYLAEKGVVFNQSYVLPVCTPSRAAMLTGYYPFKIGLQHGVIKDKEPMGLPLDFTLLPQELKKLGYDTHMIGKWHLGFCKWEYTPTFRGFDSFYGFYNGAADYYTHVQGAAHKVAGLDFRNNTKVVMDQRGIYSTDSYVNRAKEMIKYHNRSRPFFLYLPFQSVHSPLQVPKKFEALYAHIQDHDRRVYSGMVTAMDDAIGRIHQILKEYKMLRNTLIVFTTDNGGAPHHGGSNWPLRGAKTTLWEGGTRAVTFAYGSMLKKTGYVSDQLIHAVDWFPTFITAAGGKPNLKMDGVNQWRMLRFGQPSRRKEFVYNIDDVKFSAGIRFGNYKLILGSPGKYSTWYPQPQVSKHKHSNKVQLVGQGKHLYRKFSSEEYLQSSNPIKSLWKWFCCKTWSCAACEVTQPKKTQKQMKYMKKKLRKKMQNLKFPKGTETVNRNLYSLSGQTEHKVLNRLKKIVYRNEDKNENGVYLFNLKDDPLEQKDLSKRLPHIVQKLRTKLETYMNESLVPSHHVNNEPYSNPELYWGNVWSPGWCH
ncbi:arylsulfatase B isoform X1 [Lingula anatina]|uniref:Arylsulfatase B isoform X1 n=2 Tax=Lingula anatina TaxID=7574 RepID=A0A1S3JW99_LINAN|nr:arylsulfatase B isoform X1 [Lingula anatina]|eukprot:XP_013414346.1 arylsulfatase B isoform X1 [Lingula anatina]